jgi:hypothetical protein
VESVDSPKTPTPENVFKKAGQGWDIRFAGGELHHITRDYLGFFYIASLIAEPLKTFAASALQAIHAGRKTDTTTRTSKGAKQQAAQFSDKPPGRASASHTPKEILDSLAECNENRKRIDRELEKAEISEQESERLKRERVVVMREGKRLGRLLRQPTSVKNTRGAVRKAIEEAIQHIRDVDPQLGHHLAIGNSLRVKRGEWWYEPAVPVDWDVSV